ncbi:MAG TPA: nitrite reductase small subunit NirD [Polyangiaceae bacterium]|nr:nitrite reductase small subunit NirD [Polyangiaceae bacterium]
MKGSSMLAGNEATRSEGGIARFSVVAEEQIWVDVCALDDVIPGTGVAALIAGEQVAVVRSPNGESVFAISNFDPFSKAFVLARGIVGDRAGTLKIASPIYKQNFDLKTGVCLDDPSVRLPVYGTKVEAGRIFVARRSGESK